MPQVDRKAPDKTHTQSVLFWKDAGWTENTSREWCEDHDYYTDGLDETETQFRWRQYDPEGDKFDYRMEVIEPDSITLVIGFPKDGGEAKDMKLTDLAIMTNTVSDAAAPVDAELEEEAEDQAENTTQHGRNRHRGLKQHERQAIHEPIRCFEGSTKPHEPFWTFRDVADGGEPEMELYGYISEYSWFDDDVTPRVFKDDLYRHGAGGPITIRMNSYGGDVIAASLMSSIIRDYPGRVTVQIDGVAASAATVVAIAGDVVRMQETAYFMIHDPMVVFLLASLNIEDLNRLADSLQAVKEGIVNAYQSKTGLSRERLSRLMTAETWMDAQKAIDLGFADDVIHGEAKRLEIPIENAAYVNALRNFVNLPEPLRLQLRTPGTAPVVQSDPASDGPDPEVTQKLKAMDKLRAEVKLYTKE